jgi:exodeoxyribonuclease V alpha subunit
MIIYATIMELPSRTIPHFQKMNINDLIFYKKHYYKISSINLNTEYNLEYKLENIFNDQTISVLSNDRDIQYQKESSKLLVFLRFVEKYNSTIDYLNCGKVKKFSKIDIHSNYILEFEIYKDCNFNINQFYRIENLLKRIKDDNIELKNLKINPFYFITEEYQLISYDKAEMICQKYRILVGPETKLKAWSYYYFLQMNKSFYVIKTKYMNDMKKFTEEKNIVLDSVLLQNIEKIIIDKEINNELYKTTQYLLNSERKLTDKILDLFYDEDEDNINEDEINKYISNYEDEKQIKLENEQKQAVINSIKYKFSIITGPPGTGKTEIIKCINYCFYQIFIHKINILICEYETKFSVKFTEKNKEKIRLVIKEERYNNDIDSFIQPCIFYIKFKIENTISPSSISLIAPTGLAFVNMTRSQDTNYINLNISGTCHKVLYHILQSNKNSETHNDISPKVFIVDETSMLDFFVFRDLLNKCKQYGARLILIGDPNQLPSVGPGKILNQLNECNIFPIVSLNKIKRQNSGQLVQNILKMKNDIITISDFIDETMELKHVKQFVQNDGINIEEIIKLINENNLTCDNSKFITYYNKKYLWNVIEINNILQNIHNPYGTIIPSPSKFKQDYIFRVDDDIIRCENDYSGKIMRANGENAIIKGYDIKGKMVQIQYSGQKNTQEEISVKNLYEDFKLNYCVTIHKSQGSQYDNIVFIIQPGQNNIDKKSIYTAISRAKEKCIIISNPKDFIKLQTNESNNKISLFLEESNDYDITSE